MNVGEAVLSALIAERQLKQERAGSASTIAGLTSDDFGSLVVKTALLATCYYAVKCVVDPEILLQAAWVIAGIGAVVTAGVRHGSVSWAALPAA